MFLCISSGTFCPYYCKLPSFDTPKMIIYIKIYCVAVLGRNTPPIHIMCSLNLETFFKTIIITFLWTRQIKMLLLTKFYHYWSLMFPTHLIFVKIYDKNNKNYPNVWRIKLYLSNCLFCIKIVSVHQFRHSSVHIIANCNPLTSTKGQKIVYKLPFINRLNYPTHF